MGCRGAGRCGAAARAAQGLALAVAVFAGAGVLSSLRGRWQRYVEQEERGYVARGRAGSSDASIRQGVPRNVGTKLTQRRATFGPRGPGRGRRAQATAEAA